MHRVSPIDLIDGVNFSLDSTSTVTSPQSPILQQCLSSTPLATTTVSTYCVPLSSCTTISSLPGHSTSLMTQKQMCSQCSALSSTTGYGKILEDKVIFDPICLVNASVFDVETLLYFLQHKCNGSIRLQISYCPGCKGCIILSSHKYPVQVVASALRAYLQAHSHLK